MADMQSDPLPEAVHVTIFMEGLRTGVARTEVFWVHPSTFEEAVRISFNGEHNFKSARLGWNGYNPRANYTSTLAVNRPEPMDLSYPEDEGEVELQAAEQQSVTAPGYESTLYPELEVWHGTGKCRHPVGAGRPTGEELGFVTSLGGKVQQGLAPKSSIPTGMERGYKSGLLAAEAKVKGFEKP
uniref:Uncharacterized protein n=1 Tax=Hyaloperonospora arabidopsidis (strain Emoy2) TaxID=559515 RepID=M4BYD3_HYAAE